MEENIKNRLEKIAETDIFQVATLADNFRLSILSRL